MALTLKISLIEIELKKFQRALLIFLRVITALLIFLGVLYSLNFLRVKIFVDFVVLSQTVKFLTSKYLSKQTFSLRNALS